MSSNEEFRKKKMADYIIFLNPKPFEFIFQHQFFLTYHEKTSETFLSESFDLANFTRKQELFILKKISHPNILRICDVRNTEKHIHIFFEPFLEKSELLSTFLKKNPKLPVEQCLSIASDIVEAVQKLHDNCLIHRGICPNSIIKYNGEWKLVAHETSKFVKNFENDVKFSHSFQPDTSQEVYLAPEIQEQAYGQSCDAYSIGVLILEMLVGSQKVKGLKTKGGKFILQDLPLQTDIIEMLHSLLNENQNDRTSIKQLLKKIKKIKNGGNMSLSLNSNVPKATDEIKKSKTNLTEEKIMNEELTGEKKTYLKNFFEYLKFFGEVIQSKINEIPQISECLDFPGKNSLIYGITYLLTRLEFPLRKKILSLAEKLNDESKIYSKQLKISQEQISLMNDLFKGKTKFLNKCIGELIKNESAELEKNQLKNITETIKEFLVQLFEMKPKKNKKLVLGFLDQLIMIQKETLKDPFQEDIYMKKRVIEVKSNKYKREKLEELKKRSENIDQMKESELRDNIKINLDK